MEKSHKLTQETAENVVSCSRNADICSNRPFIESYFARFGRTLFVYRQAAAHPSCRGVRKERTKDLLTGPAGSCRFICVEVTFPIDTNVPVIYRQLYAQAMTMNYHGERYWLDDKDEAVLHQSNQ